MNKILIAAIVLFVRLILFNQAADLLLGAAGAFVQAMLGREHR